MSFWLLLVKQGFRMSIFANNEDFRLTEVSCLIVCDRWRFNTKFFYFSRNSLYFKS